MWLCIWLPRICLRHDAKFQRHLKNICFNKFLLFLLQLKSWRSPIQSSMIFISLQLSHRKIPSWQAFYPINRNTWPRLHFNLKPPFTQQRALFFITLLNQMIFIKVNWFFDNFLGYSSVGVSVSNWLLRNPFC